MNIPKIHKDDVGTKIILDVGTDVSTATDLRIVYKKPNGVSGYWPAQLDPEDPTKIYYIVQEGDLDVVGVWIVQAYVEMPSWKGHGTEAKFNVVGHIEVN